MDADYNRMTCQNNNGSLIGVHYKLLSINEAFKARFNHLYNLLPFTASSWKFVRPGAVEISSSCHTIGTFKYHASSSDCLEQDEICVNKTKVNISVIATAYNSHKTKTTAQKKTSYMIKHVTLKAQ